MKNLLHFTLIFLFFFTLITAHEKDENNSLVNKLCPKASYPDICLRTLSTAASSAATPRDLAQCAVRVSLAHVRKATQFLSTLDARGKEQKALNDCVEQMGDSVDELSKTLEALQHMRRGADFQWQMSNAETWVSAALTNEDTCLDGFRDVDGKVRSDVHRRITNVARVTSNALYIINQVDD